MTNLWKRQNFEALNIDTPKDIVEAQCTNLFDMTEGRIIARVKEIPCSGFGKFITKRGVIEFKEGFAYEFYITSHITLNYKYSVMKFIYNLPVYPVGIRMNFDLSDEIIIDYCESQNEFVNVLADVLNSETIKTVIGSLLAIVEKEESQQSSL